MVQYDLFSGSFHFTVYYHAPDSAASTSCICSEFLPSPCYSHCQHRESHTLYDITIVSICINTTHRKPSASIHPSLTRPVYAILLNMYLKFDNPVDDLLDISSFLFVTLQGYILICCENNYHADSSYTDTQRSS